MGRLKEARSYTAQTASQYNPPCCVLHAIAWPNVHGTARSLGPHLPSYVNFFSGNPLNRLAWLRTSQSFLNAIVHAPATRWLVFRDGQPLLQSAREARSDPFKQSLARLTTRDVRPLLGPEPFFHQGQHEGELAPPDTKGLEAARLRGAPIVFLGLHETETTFAAALPSSDFSAKADLQTLISNIQGDAYFSLDVTDVNPTELDNVLQSSVATSEGSQLAFTEPRAVMSTLSAFESALFAEARSTIDWNTRNKVRSPVHRTHTQTRITDRARVIYSSALHADPQSTPRGQDGSSHARLSSRGRTMPGRSPARPRRACTTSLTPARTRSLSWRSSTRLEIKFCSVAMYAARVPVPVHDDALSNLSDPDHVHIRTTLLAPGNRTSQSGPHGSGPVCPASSSPASRSKTRSSASSGKRPA